MFSPPPSGTNVRRHIRPYKLAPLQREMYIQQAIGDSPFYSSASMLSNESSKGLPPYLSPPGSSIPMLMMTDDGGDEWEVLSEVTESEEAQSSNTTGDSFHYDDDYYNDDPFEDPSEDDFFDEDPSYDEVSQEYFSGSASQPRIGSPHPSRSSATNSRILPKISQRSSARSDSYASSNFGTRDIESAHSGDSGIQQGVNDDMAENLPPENDSFVVGPPQSEIYGLQVDCESPVLKRIESDIEEDEEEAARSKAPSPEQMPEKPSSSTWKSTKSRGYASDDGKKPHHHDDEGYDSSKERERRRKIEAMKRKKARIRANHLRSEIDPYHHGKTSKFMGEKFSTFKVIKIGLFKNGDPWIGPVDFQFIPGREVPSLDSLLRMIDPKMKMIHGVTYLFDTDGRRITSLEQISNGGSYVCASSRKFIPGNYGAHSEVRLGTNLFKKPSSDDQEISTDIARSPIHAGDGRVIQIINAQDQSVRAKVLLNLKTTQSFEEVLADLGQVLTIRRAKLMCTKEGLEVHGFNQLRGVYAKETTFLVSASRAKVTYEGSDDEDPDLAPIRPDPPRMPRRNSDPAMPRSLARVPSRASSDQGPANENEWSSDPIKVMIKGDRKIFFPPSEGYRKIIGKPKSSLILDWVYGCKGSSEVTRNLWVLASGELVYFVATTVVIYDRIKESQRHYRGHTEEITCMDVHPGKCVALSGQKNGKTHDSRAHIRLWDVNSLETLAVLGFGEYELKVAAVAFSTQEAKDELLFTGIDGGGEDHVLSVWQWEAKLEKAILLGKVATRADGIKGVAFHPLDSHLVISYGKGHLTFWTRRKDGFFDRNDMVEDDRTVNCLDFLESGDLVAGDDSGAVRSYSVSIEGEYYMSSEFEAHSKGVNAILVFGDGTVVTGGDKDKKLINWDSTKEFAKGSEVKLPDGVGSARSFCKKSSDQGAKDTGLYIGTTRNCILEGSGSKRSFKIAVWGHSNKLEAVASHPDDLAFVTAGYDKIVAKWRKQKVLWKVTTQSELISVAYHPSASSVAAASLDGHVVILNAETGVHITTLRVCSAPVNELKFNRTGDFFACAAHSGVIHIYRTSHDGYTYKKEAKFALSNAAITALDWSEDSHNLAAVTADFNLVHADVRLQRVERRPELIRDQTWLDQTCTLGFNVAGTWNNLGYKNDPTTTTAVHIGSHRTKVASGDAHGHLRLFQYPCTTSRAEFVEEKAASSPISGIRFLFEDMYIITVGGGSDATLLRWKIV